MMKKVGLLALAGVLASQVLLGWTNHARPA